MASVLHSLHPGMSNIMLSDIQEVVFKKSIQIVDEDRLLPGVVYCEGTFYLQACEIYVIC